MLLENGSLLLLEDGAQLLLEGPGTAVPGTGTASVGPTAQGETWQAGFTVSVHCSTRLLEATCRVYCGPGPTPAYFVDGTTWGSTGDSTSSTPQLSVGQLVWAVWEGGDPGAEAYLTVTGTRTV